GEGAERLTRLGADRWHAHHHLVLRWVAVGLNDGVLAAARKVLVERLAHLLHRDRPIELLDHDRAARELDTFGNPLGPDRDDAGDDDDPRQDERVDSPAQEVVIRVLENVHKTRCSGSRLDGASRVPVRTESSTRKLT